MRIFSNLGTVLPCFLALVASSAMIPAAAHGAHAAPSDKIAVQDCWIRLLPAKLPSAAYFRLVNTGPEAVALTAVSTNAYAHVMLHATTTSQGMSRMQHVHAVTVPAQGHVDFAPGGYHVMLEQAVRDIRVGDALPMLFTFTQGESVQADCAVRAANAVQQEPHPHHHHH